ncbi:MAG: flagellar basal body-associated FliL family protein [Candidatus Latescibacteria bacterium]|nr:flagellar basal body-associated FliL family protein [Candidatus Latescibacterota bacterium]
MADEPAPAEQPTPPPKSRGLLGYLPVIFLVLLIQAGGAYFLIEKYMFRKQKASATIGQGVVEALSEEAGFKDPPDLLPKYDEPEDVVELEDMHANPAGTRGDATVFCKVVLGVAPAKVKEEIQTPEVKAKIQDDILSVLSSHPPEMMDQPDDKRALREEIKVRINAYLTKGQVVEVYFGKFFLQIAQ